MPEEFPVPHVLAVSWFQGFNQVCSCLVFSDLPCACMPIFGGFSNLDVYCCSQELFEAVVQERNFRATSQRNAAVFRNLGFGDFDLQHVSYLRASE